MELIAQPIIDEYIASLQNDNETLKKVKLVVYQIDNDGPSCSYVKSKVNMFNKVGAICTVKHFDSSISKPSDIIEEVKKDNEDSAVSGIIVQNPVPKGYEIIAQFINPYKDVDGFLKNSSHEPCTPLGVVKLLASYNIDTINKNVVIVGRSREVGLPLANMLSSKRNNANVTLLHSKTSEANLKMYLNNADIVVGCCGVADLIKTQDCKDGAVLINIGMTRIKDNSTKCGYKTHGDINIINSTDNLERFKGYTPILGSTGPMTVLALLSNTIDSYLAINN